MHEDQGLRRPEEDLEELTLNEEVEQSREMGESLRERSKHWNESAKVVTESDILLRDAKMVDQDASTFEMDDLPSAGESIVGGDAVTFDVLTDTVEDGGDSEHVEDAETLIGLMPEPAAETWPMNSGTSEDARVSFEEDVSGAKKAAEDAADATM